MRPKVYSYTNKTNTGQDTTINDGTHFISGIATRPIIDPADAAWITRGDGQEPLLAGVSIQKGMELWLNFTCKGSPIGTDYDTLAAMFNRWDTRQKTLVIENLDDPGRYWTLTCRNLGVGAANNKFVPCKIAVLSSVMLGSATITESTWTNASLSSKTVTKAIGNFDACPIFDITPSVANTNGNKYSRFITTYNWTKSSAPGYPIDLTNGGIDTASLITYTATSTTSAMAGVTASVPATGGTLTNLTSTAAFPAVGMVMYGTEQITYTGKTGTTLTGITRGANGSTAAIHANPTTVYLSKMCFDGRDIRVFIGNNNGAMIETPYWLGTGANVINTSVTKIWTYFSYDARASGSLRSSITNADTSLTLDTTTITGNFAATNGVLYMDTEAMTYTAFDSGTGIFTGLVRASKGTTAASHTSLATAYSIHDFWTYYGNPLATTPVYPADLKPQFALNSTNSLWTYSTFASVACTSSYEWKPSTVGDPNGTFTADASAATPFTQPAPVDPVTEIGVSLQVANGSARWLSNYPFGWTAATATTIKRLNLPANQCFLLSSDGTLSAIAAQSTTWGTTASQTITPTSTSKQLSLYIKNTTGAAYARRAGVSIATIAVTLSTLTTSDSFGVPYISMSAEMAVDVDIDTTITNTTTGESLRIKYPDVAVGYTLRLNTLLKTAIYTLDNRSVFSAIQRPPARDEYLRLIDGANVFTCSQASLDIVISYQPRQNTLG